MLTYLRRDVNYRISYQNQTAYFLNLFIVAKINFNCIKTWSVTHVIFFNKNLKGILRNILVPMYLSCKTIRMYDYCNACNYLTFATLKCVKSPSLEVREQETLKLNDSMILKTSDANARSLCPVLATGKMQNYSHSLTLSNTTAL